MINARALFTTAVAVALAAQAAPAAAQDSGTVSATVTVAEAPGACLTVGTSAVAFGTLPFSTTAGTSSGAAPAYAVTNCGASAIDVRVRGTNASGDGGAAWTLSPTADCAQLDAFRVDVVDDSVFPPVVRSLGTTDTSFLTLTGQSGRSVDTTLAMPCVGSAGAGEVMSFDVVYTAVVR